ncbi:MAG: tetratricopeptide repeat protein, partial [Candidatus Latescibacteria bacterium]|nr:tetratricopeptide repeat protein [Candidatus Latescibacterota bacterium]NIM64647.1 tetratricopeptide repeat protein [Candidatus Latescibacterota bacterium]NIO01163.1 tetratricopeptide repeat protein [Candidatus Latescibacterota bacterium]NIT03085.1 tetratricopeptide repeat protein [Candidatus Latescibacterota bacterium]NIT38089.1 tetratricopeptide repeat protein [Candidatus Latescibacterota bacterium]
MKNSRASLKKASSSSIPACRWPISTIVSNKPKRPSKRFNRPLERKTDQKELFAFLSSLYRKAKNFPKAIEAMERVVTLDPKSDQALFQLGALYDESKNKDKTIYYMKKAIELNPKNAAALNYLGYTWAEMGIQLDEA